MQRSLFQLKKLATARSSRVLTGCHWPSAAAISAVARSDKGIIWNREQWRLKSSVAAAAFDQTVESFPSIVIGANGSIVPQGTFAEAQAEVRKGKAFFKDAEAGLRGPNIWRSVLSFSSFWNQIMMQSQILASRCLEQIWEW